MTTKSTRKGAASVTLIRPNQPMTASKLEEALAPLLAALGGLEFQDVASIHITHSSIRLGLVPLTRGRKQLDSMLRVSYPVVWDEEA